MTQAAPYQKHYARHFAVQAHYQWLLSGTDLAELIAQYRADNAHHKKQPDWSYFQTLVKASVMEATSLDALYEDFLDRPLEQIDAIEKAILRIAACELQNHIEIPFKVVIDEAVELAKTFGATDSFKYINGVVDQMAKQLRTIEVAANQR